MSRAPHFLFMLVIWLIASVGVAIAGPFGTIGLPFDLRLPYWLALIGVNMVKWNLWFHVAVRYLGSAPRTMGLIALAGVVVINLPLPLEVHAISRLFGSKGAMPYWPVYLSAVGLGVTMTIGIILIRWAQRVSNPTVEMPVDVPASIALPDETAAISPVEPPVGGLMIRASVADPTQVLAVEAEDHYLRLYLADGRKPLVLYRLRDALAELAPLDGEQVHRGYWVSSRAVIGLERRDGRKWALRLEGGLVVPVSTTYMPAVRRRGWREMAV